MANRGRDPINVHVGKRVRLVRRSHGLAQKQLAAVIDVSFQQLQKYERGLNRIGPGPLYRLACFLGVPVEFFFQDLPQEVLETLPAEPAGGSGGAPLRRPALVRRGVDPAISTLHTDRTARRLLHAFARLEDHGLKTAIADFVHGVAPSAVK